MFGAEASLVDGERATHERLSLGKPVGFHEHSAQPTCCFSGFQVIGPMLSARRLDVALGSGNGLLTSSGLAELPHLPAQCIQLRIGLSHRAP